MSGVMISWKHGERRRETWTYCTKQHGGSASSVQKCLKQKCVQGRYAILDSRLSQRQGGQVYLQKKYILPPETPHKHRTSSCAEGRSTMAASSLPLDKLQLLILEQLDAAPIADTRELKLQDGTNAGGSHSEHMAVKAALDSLAGKEMVAFEQRANEILTLSAEGESMAEKGSHEFRVWQALDAEKTAPQLQAELGNDVAQVGQLNAFKKKWIKRQGAGFSRAVSFRTISVDDD